MPAAYLKTKRNQNLVQRKVTNIINGQPVEVVFTSVAEDGSQVPEIRAIQANIYMQREFVHGLSLKVAGKIYEQMIKTLHEQGKSNEVKQQEIAVLVHNLQVRAANTLNTDNLLRLAAIYFTVDGETINDCTGQYDEYKVDVMKKASFEDRLFFCEKACEYTPALKQVSDIDLAACLNQTDSLIYSQTATIPKQ